MELARSVLGCLLLGADPAAVTPQDFVSPAHRALLEAVKQLRDQGLAPEAALICDQMQSHPHEFWREEWTLALGSACAEKNLPACLAALREQRRKTDLHMASMRLTDLIESGGSENEILAASSDLKELAHPRSLTEPVSLSAALAELFTVGPSRSVPLGLACLDRLQIIPGNLAAVGARTGIGKSAMLSSIALASLRSGWQVYFLSLEMPRLEILRRLLAAYCDLPLPAVQRADSPSLIPKAQEFARSPLRIDGPTDRPPVPFHVQDLRARILEFTRRHADRDSVVLIDYLQLIRTRNRTEKRYEALGDVCRTLKETAGSARVPIIAGCQVGRAAEDRRNKGPKLHELRESGDIEQDSDAVLLIDREGSRSFLNVAKQRNGPTFTAECEFVADRCLFRDRDDYGAF